VHPTRHQNLDLRGWLESELGCQQVAEQPVLTDGLTHIALREVGAHEQPVRALAQRLGGDRGVTRLDRGGVAARRGELLAEFFQRVQPELTEALTLDSSRTSSVRTDARTGLSPRSRSLRSPLQFAARLM
jgi:hypothetical protein